VVCALFSHDIRRLQCCALKRHTHARARARIHASSLFSYDKCLHHFELQRLHIYTLSLYPDLPHPPQTCTCLILRAELSQVVVACADSLRGVFRVHVLLLLRVRLCQRHLFQRELLNPPVLLNLSYRVWGSNSCLTRLSAALGFRPAL
jgi:hypothetical protein